MEGSIHLQLQLRRRCTHIGFSVLGTSQVAWVQEIGLATQMFGAHAVGMGGGEAAIIIIIGACRVLVWQLEVPQQNRWVSEGNGGQLCEAQKWS